MGYTIHSAARACPLQQPYPSAWLPICSFLLWRFAGTLSTSMHAPGFNPPDTQEDRHDMKAVILAGGFGSRLSEETQVKPKPMIVIGGKPVIWHIMKLYSH